MYRNLFIYMNGSLLWKESRRGIRGRIAGTLGKDGYIRVTIAGERTPAHHIVWIMHGGEIPDGFEIDHINHIKSDNRIENLRLVRHSDNQKNMKRQERNSSGYTGVYWNKEASMWRARITANGKSIYSKNFDNWFDAVCWRMSKNNELTFNENHGRIK